jgi:CheY-like chemotaxis protein
MSEGSPRPACAAVKIRAADVWIGRMRTSRGTVLIVDDDASVIQTFARMLQLEGYDVVTALDAEAGFRKTRTMRLDAILLDLRMPLMDGMMFLRRLRDHEQERRTPVAIITGDYCIDGTVTRELQELGAVICLKPLWLEDLVRITERLLRTIQ